MSLVEAKGGPLSNPPQAKGGPRPHPPPASTLTPPPHGQGASLHSALKLALMGTARPYQPKPSPHEQGL